MPGKKLVARLLLPYITLVKQAQDLNIAFSAHYLTLELKAVSKQLREEWGIQRLA
jgi:hypothetical protein